MQSFSQFGFTVEPYFTTTQMEYESLKTSLEKIGHLAEKMQDGISAILLDDDKSWLTTYKYGAVVRLGVFTSDNKQLSTDIVYGYPVISEQKCKNYLHRLEEHIKSGRTMKHSVIEATWNKTLQKEISKKNVEKER